MKLCVSAFAAAALTVAAGCIDDVPPAGLVLCADDNDCPDDLVCVEARHTCEPRGTQATPPSVLSVRFDPPVTTGGAVELIIVADQVLSPTTPAAVTFAPGVPAPTLAFASSDSTEQRFLIDADALNEGGYVVDSVTVTDEDGDVGTATGVNAGLVVDRTAPAVFNAVVVDGPADGIFADVDGRDLVQLTAVANEPVLSAAISISGAVTACSVAVTQIACTAVIGPETVSSPAAPVSLIAFDRAGNSATVEQASIVIDTDPAGVSVGAVEVTGADVPGPGAVVSVVVIADEDLGAADPTAVVDDGEVSVPFTLVSRVGRRLEFRIDGDDVPLGVYDVAVALADVVGHPSEVVVDLPPPFEAGLSFALGAGCPPPAGASACVDVDGDGHSARDNCPEGSDADDRSTLVFPGAREIPGDGVDNDQVAGDRVPDVDLGVFCDIDAPAGGDGSRDAPLNDLDDCVAARPENGDLLFVAQSATPYTSSFVELAGVSIVGGFDATTWTRRPGDRSVIVPDLRYGSGDQLLVGVEAQFVGVVDATIVIADTAVATLFADISALRLENVQANLVAMESSEARVALSDLGSYENINTSPSTTMSRTIVRGRVSLDGPSSLINVAVLASGLANQPAVQHSDGTLTLAHSTIVGGAGPVVTAGATLVAVGNVFVRGVPGEAINGGPLSFTVRDNVFVGVDDGDAVEGDDDDGCVGRCAEFSGNDFADDAGFATLFHLDADSDARDFGVDGSGLASAAVADFDFDCRYADGSADAGADEF